MYNVVLKNIGKGMTEGVISCMSFENEQKFKNWYDSSKKDLFQVVKKGVSITKAAELCRSEEAQIARKIAQNRQLQEFTD